MRRFSKRLLLVLTAIVITLMGLTVSETAPATYIDEYKNKSGYLSLSEKQKNCYDAVYTTLTDTFDTDQMVTYKDGTQSIGVQVSLPGIITSFDEAREVFTAVWRDNPHFFHLDNRYSIQHSTMFGKEVYTDITLLYTMDSTQRARARKKLDAVVYKLTKDLPDTKDDYIKELRLHNALLEICTYDEEAAAADKPGKNKNVYSAYGALVEGRAVCEGYARAMQLLLTQAGIKSSLISGKAVNTGEGHIWNLVTINGYQYHLDPTWNDVNDRTQHVFFNCTTAQIKHTHNIDKQFNSIVCGAVKDNFYMRNNLCLQTADQEYLIDVIANQLAYRTDCIEIQFSPKAYKQAQEFLKNTSLTCEMVNAKLYYTHRYLWRYNLYSYDGIRVLCLQRR